MSRWIVAIMRLRARWRDARGACICCGVYGAQRGVCFDCYYKWTFDGWRPWWLSRP